MGVEDKLDTFQKKKRERVAYIFGELLRRGGEADLREFEGSIASTYGIRRKTLEEEYFKDLQYFGAIDVTDNKIVLRWDKAKAEDWLKRQGIKAKPNE